MEKYAPIVLRGYFESYLLKFDFLVMQETLDNELAKINDPDIENHPMQCALQTLINCNSPEDKGKI